MRLRRPVTQPGPAWRWLWAGALGIWLSAAPPKTAAAVLRRASDDPVHVYLFWGNGCSHCAKAKPFLESLAKADPRVVLHEYEVWYDEANHELFESMTQSAGFEARYVPTIFIGSRHWEGYSEEFAREIESTVAACLAKGCPDPGAGILTPPDPAAQPAGPAPDEPSTTVRIPLVGTVDLSAQSLPVATVVIALVDGFNPCSLWVLTMLLALTLHTGSRRKVLLIGLIFLAVTAAVYGLFIAGLFTVFSVLSFTGWIQTAVALVALLFALVNLKDYFWYKEGLSLTIDDSKKPGIARRMRALMDPDIPLWSLAFGTVALSAGVSLVEFSCTAGFPMLWTNLLSAQNVGPAAFILLLVLYLFIYQLDELAIFGAAVYSLKASRIEEKHGRILKLAGGMLMLTLAAVMLIRPALMNDLGSSLLIFGAALAAVLLVLLVHRVVLPRLGVRIGSEFSGKGR